MLNNMLEFDYHKRFSIQEVLSCNWFGFPVDELNAKNDIKFYFNQMKEVFEKNKMEQEFDREYKCSSVANDKKSVLFKDIPFSDFKPQWVFFYNKKKLVVDKIIDCFYMFSKDLNGRINWTEDSSRLFFSFKVKNQDVLCIKVNFFVLDKGFAVELIRTEGSAFTFYDIKNKFTNFLKQ